ncbi:MAG TPA: general secretion pathway protein GspB [Pseudomonadales bacterium]
MSFVLEALKKQEADRDPDAAVSLAKAGALHRRHRRWMALFAVAMAANAVLVGWLLWGGPAAPRAGDGAAATVEQPASTQSAPQPRSSAMWEAPAVAAEPGPALAAELRRSEPAPAPVTPPPVAAKQPEPAPAPAAAQTSAPTAGPGIVGLDELTPAERRRFPGIAFSTHIYSEDPELRAVVANGQRRQEGDRIRGLEILQITRDGVVLAFEDKRVKVPLAVDWDSL